MFLYKLGKLPKFLFAFHGALVWKESYLDKKRPKFFKAEKKRNGLASEFFYLGHIQNSPCRLVDSVDVDSFATKNVGSPPWQPSKQGSHQTTKEHILSY